MLVEYNEKPFQKKEGSRKGLFDLEERTFLLPLPRTRYENAFWRSFTVQFNYHMYSTLTVIERVLDSKPIEQRAYKGCMANNEKKKGSTKQPQGITRGADYYRRNND